jgi:hypothetical protein
MVYREPILPTGHISLLTRREVRGMITAAGLSTGDPDLGGVYVPVIAEAGGERALRLEQRMEEPLRRSIFKGMLWTQYWIAERAA